MNPTEGVAVAREVAAAGRVPGLVFAAATPTGLAFAGAVGHSDLATGRPATVDDQFLWFSMTKIATATAVLRLAATGVVDLDTPIDVWLPAYRAGRHGAPTLRQLLTHTAGLGNPLPVRWVAPVGRPADPRLLEGVVRRHGSPKRLPGGRAVYSNIGYLLAGQVVEAATGTTVQQCVTDLVLEPLALRRTGYAYAPEAPAATGYVRLPRPAVPLLHAALPRGIVGDRVAGYTALRPFLVAGPAYGGLVGTVSDAARLAGALAAGPDDPHPVLGHAELAEMRTIRHPGKPFDHGIGWFRRPADADRSPGFVEHYGTGGGFWNAMRIYPERRLAVVAMANTTESWDVDRLFGELVAAAG